VLVAASRQARTSYRSAPIARYARRDRSIPPRSRGAVEPRFSKIASRPLVPWPPAGGLCEVVVYTDAHDGSFATLPAVQLDRLAEIWTDRYRDLTARRGIKYVFIFENRGEQVGVTLHHPTGKIYAYPFVPPVAAIELGRHAGGCLQCRVIQDELTARRRILINEGGIVAYVPRPPRWPYEVHVDGRAQSAALRTFRPPLAGESWRRCSVSRAPSTLFELPMPYMMSMHQAPAKVSPQAHLHVEYLSDSARPGAAQVPGGVRIGGRCLHQRHAGGGIGGSAARRARVAAS